MECEVHGELEVYETERKPRRMQSKEELRLNGEERKWILKNLVVGNDATATNAALSHGNPCLDDNIGHQKGCVGGECCRVYPHLEPKKLLNIVGLPCRPGYVGITTISSNPLNATLHPKL
jgi:hypothetical protein